MRLNLKMMIGGIAVLFLLAGAAFAAMRLLNWKVPGAGLNSSVDTGRVNPGSGKRAGISITFDPAPVLPRQAADLIGTVTGTKDNSIYVVMMTKGSEAVPPSEEVVVVKETRLYRDATLDNQPPPSESQHLQQVVETIPLSKISPQNVVEVWGQKRGERWIADVIVVHDR